MLRKSLIICWTLAPGAWCAAGAELPKSQLNLTAAQVVEKNVAARGGLEAWRAIKTMTLSGKLGAGGNQRATLQVPNEQGATVGRKTSRTVMSTRSAEEVELPFRMELKRPRKMRFELQFNGQTALQVYDGANGWKFRPFLNRKSVEPYTEEELKLSSMQAELDGPLVDYAAKGTQIELAGTEKVEDRDNYKVKLTLKGGQTVHVWIDAVTFLETKIEGQPRRLDGVEHPVHVYFRDYRRVNGVQIPYVLETVVLRVSKTALGVKDPPVPPERIVIDRVVINPDLDESLFIKPNVDAASTMSTKL
jgi:outer membrane lipoprotein-sorting protein